MSSFARYKLQIKSDLEFDLSRSLKVKSNGAFRRPIYDFLLVSNSNYLSSFRSYNHSKYFLLSLIIRPKFWTAKLTLTPSQFFSKPNPFFPGSKGRLPSKMKSIGWMLGIFGNRRTYAHGRTHEVIAETSAGFLAKRADIGTQPN